MKLPNWRSLSQLFAKVPAVLGDLPPYVKTGVFRSLCVLSPVLLFLCFFNPYVIDPTRIGWLMQADWGQHVLGWNAFRHSPWSTFNHEYLLGAPVGNTIISTDSNPLFAFLFKPFRAFLPANFQYIGPWFLFCVCMHFTFAYKLIRPHAPNRWAALGGALALSALPALYYRMRHDTLMAQWLILWALHLFINVPRDEAGESARTRGYAALLTVTGLVHPYLLFMVAAIWGGDVWRRLVPAAKALDRKALLDIGWRAAAVLFCAIVALGIAGSYTKGMSPGAGGFGFYSMGLDAFFNPVRPEFSAILKAWPQDGGQSFEGYQYLGFGLLLLLAAAVVLYILTPEAREARAFFVWLKPLTLPFIALLLIALSNHIQIYGYTVLRFAVPDPLKNTVAILRASGRFFWPIAYCMVMAALVVIYKCRPKIMHFVLPAILVVQVYDLAGFSQAMRDATAQAANPQVYTLTPSPLWDKLVGRATGVDFYPANVHFNDKLFYEVSWRASSTAKPVNTMYPARENIIQLANQRAGQAAFKNGEVVSDHLFVFLKQCDAPDSLQPRLRMLDGVWIIPPASASDIPLEKPTWSPIRANVRFGWLDQGTCLLDQNWSQPEYDGVWSEGPQADVTIPIKYMQFDTPKPKALDLNIRARSHKPVTVSVLVNGKKLGDIDLTRARGEYTLHLPISVLRFETMQVRFVFPDAEATGADVVAQSVALPPPTGRSPQVQTPAPKVKTGGLKLMDMRLVDPTAALPPAQIKG